jgi:hypothetical protein
MANIRTQVKEALLAKLADVTFDIPINGASTWASTATRRLKLWGNIDPSNQPACFLVQHREQYERRGSGLPPRRYLDLGAWCYAPSGDESVVGDDLLDTMTGAIETALLPPIGTYRNEQTLDGLLDPSGWVRIDAGNGLFIRDPGDIDGQALLVLPIKVLLP